MGGWNRREENRRKVGEMLLSSLLGGVQGFLGSVVSALLPPIPRLPRPTALSLRGWADEVLPVTLPRFESHGSTGPLCRARQPPLRRRGSPTLAERGRGATEACPPWLSASQTLAIPREAFPARTRGFPSPVRFCKGPRPRALGRAARGGASGSSRARLRYSEGQVVPAGCGLGEV